MKLRQVFRATVAVLVLVLACSSGVGAEVVGRLSQLEGRVDILKGGNLPATPAKVEDAVESKDVIRTKSLSKAQITFIDNSIINLSPDSRIVIEEYHFEPGSGKRLAVLELFRGLAHVVVNKIFSVDNPDFIVKTHTAVTGVRGTDFGIRLQPNASTILNFKGLTQVANIFPEVGNLNRRAFKVAFAFGPPGSHNSVLLKDMQGTMVGRGLPPTLPFTVTAEDQKQFMNQLSYGLLSREKEQGSGSSGSSADSVTGGGVTGGGTEFMTNPGGTLLATNAVADSSSLGLTTGTGSTGLTFVNTVTVPPMVVPTQQIQIQTQPSPITPLSGVAIPVFNILTVWGAGASDLDLHLTGPQGQSTFHVYYASPGSLTSQPFALLNRDDTGTSGSEVITVQQFNQGGAYQVLVYNYGNQSTTSTNLSTTAGVSLTVINGGTVVPTSNGSTVQGGTVVATLTPTLYQAGNTWYAVTINPATGQITLVNQIINTTNGIASSTASGSTTTPSGTTTALATPSITSTSSLTSTTSNTSQPASSDGQTRTSSTTLATVMPTVTPTTTPSITPAATGTTSVMRRTLFATVNHRLNTRPGANVITNSTLTTPLAAANFKISSQLHQAHRQPQLLRQPRPQVQPQRQPLPAANENAILSNGRR
ncbi:MAG: hypothetical protein A2139_12645 [Desulfobacca sp. RBG_16_60_12]|nr:MAG: hypothetical protein A2139_12645 [Desulfobacca sp. RBG_16_60_12]